MKKIKLIIAGVFVVFLSFGLAAQNDDGPPEPPGHGQTSDQDPGGQAPVSGGVLVLMLMGIGYGGKKIYELKKTDTPA